MEVLKGASAQSQGSASTRKRAGPDYSDAAMKRQRTEQTGAQDVSSCGKPVHGTRQKLKPWLPTFPGGLMQASYLLQLPLIQPRPLIRDNSPSMLGKRKDNITQLRQNT